MDPHLVPLLKRSVRIKRMQVACFIMDAIGDKGTVLSPLQAFLLVLCNGSYDYATVQRIFAHSMRWQQDQVSSFTDKTLQELERYLEWHTSPVPENDRYDPVDFLYDPQTSPFQEQKRFESPAEMTIVLTHACNFRCVYCFNSSGEPRQSEMSADEILGLIDQAAEMQVLKCTLTGGEPLTHPGFPVILSKLVRSGIIPYVSTNGSLVDSEHVQMFVDAGLSLIQISLDAASAQMHDRMVVVPGTFPQVVAAMRACVAAGIQVNVKSVMTPLNWTEAEALIDLCHEIGVTQLLLDRFDPSGSGRGSAKLFLSQDQENEIAALIERKLPEVGRDMSLRAVTTPRCWSNEKDIISCGGLRTAVTIMPNGNVTTCEKLINHSEMTAGNVREKSLQEIWASPRASAIVAPPLEEIREPCKSCEFLDGCGTGCYDQSLLCTDSPYAVDPRCWRATYEGSFYDDYLARERAYAR